MGATSSNVWIGKVIKSIFSILFFGIIFTSCNDQENKSKKIENTLSTGELKIISDPTFQSLLGTSAEVFEAVHPDAKINLEYIPQEQAILNLLEGKTDVVVTGRPLTKGEEAKVRNRGLFPKVNQIASDGLIFIVSSKNLEEQISEAKITQILSGTLKIQLVCDQSNSSNIGYLKNRFKLSNEVKNVQAAGSDSAVIEYVTNHPESIGIIGMALVSDKEDPKVKNRLSNINLLSIQYKDSTGNAIIGYPTLEDLATKKYPFIRNIFVINLDGNTNLGTGFANYMVSERAQRIILKAGLLPFQLPGREIIIND